MEPSTPSQTSSGRKPERPRARYAILLTVSRGLKFYAWLAAGLGIVGFFIVLAMNLEQGILHATFTGGLLVLGGGFLFITFYALGEAVHVALSIEHHIRRNSQLLEMLVEHEASEVIDLQGSQIHYH